jgi:transposase
MPMEKVCMKKIKEILRLHYEQHRSQREISRSIGISLGSVSHYLKRALDSQIGWPLPEGLSDQELYKKLYPKALKATPESRLKGELDFNKIHQELKRKGVTLLLLWYEYKATNPQGYSYSRYCHLYQDYCGGLNPSMRLTHYAGDKLFVDYSGLTIGWVERETGVIHQAEVFVAVLGASNYTYVEASESQNLRSWINAHIHAFEFFNGVPHCLVPDNLKSGITKAHLYDPDVNASYQDLANHYGVAVVPARAYSPKDKPKVEVGVQGIQRWVIAPLRDVTFFSIEAINEAIRPLLKGKRSRNPIF